jgi:uncharacterized protein (DUF433 family)
MDLFEPRIEMIGGTPRIAGSRVNVYDVYYYTDRGYGPEWMAGFWRMPVECIHAALRYIDEHRDEVRSVHEAVEARNARGNPPELRAKLEAISAKYASLKAEMARRVRARERGEPAPGDDSDLVALARSLRNKPLPGDPDHPANGNGNGK